MTGRGVRQERQRGQSLVEISLTIPVILLLVFGVFEFGRIIFIYSSLNNASREAARYGAATGAVGLGIPRYLDCDGIRKRALETAVLSGLTDAGIHIAYDTPSGSDMVQYANCGDAGLSDGDIKLGDRVVVTVTQQIEPIILRFLPAFSPVFVTARSILKDIAVGQPECNDGSDNDGDGARDYPADSGCTSPNDTTEAFCYRLSLVALPADAGTMALNPGTNCSNRYVEGTIVNLQAFEDLRTEPDSGALYTFDYWTGITAGNVYSNPTAVLIDADKTVTAHFRPVEADVRVTKSSSDDTVASQTPFSYQIVVGNPQKDPAHNVVVTDTLPAGVDYQNVWTSSEPDAVCIEVIADSRIVCTIPRLDSGAIAVFDIEVIAPVVSFEPETITNVATVAASEFDPDPLNNTATASTKILPRAELSLIDKEDLSDPVFATDSFKYVIDVLNSGPSIATGVLVEDTLPVGMDFDSSGSAGCNFDDGSRTVSCPIGQIGVGETAFVVFSVLAPTEGQTMTNVASVSGNELEEDPDDNTSDPEQTEILSLADLSLSKTAIGTVQRDVSFDYLLNVTNAGPSEAVNVVVTDTLPNGVQLNYSDNPYGPCTEAGNQVRCNLQNMPSGSSRQILLNVTSSVEGSIVNNAVVGSDTEDRFPANNHDSATDTVKASAALSISKRSSLSTVGQGDSFDYTITVANAGPSDATYVTIADTLPAGVTFNASSLVVPLGWTCAYDGLQLVTCRPDNPDFRMAAGTGLLLTIPVTATALGTHTNSATIVADEGSATAEADTSVTASSPPSVDLSVAISGPVTGAVDAPLTYTVTVSNNGLEWVTDVRLTVTLTSSVTFSGWTKVSGGLWSCAPYDTGDHQLVCGVNVMVSQTQAIFRITLVPTDASTIIIESAVLANESSDDSDPNNDSDSWVTTVEP